MIGLMVFIISSVSAFSQEDPCPSPAFAVEYISPVTMSKKITCGYLEGESLIRHGPEDSFDQNGQKNKREFFEHGKRVQETKTVSENESFKTIHNLMKLMAFDRRGKRAGYSGFKIEGCESAYRTWVHRALTSQSIMRNLFFSESCDVSGQFKGSFLSEFPVLLNLKNLQDFTRAKMMVNLEIRQSREGIHYQFKVSEGMLTNGAKTIGFSAEYEVQFDPLTGSANYETEHGQMTITRLNDKDLSLSRALLFQ